MNGRDQFERERIENREYAHARAARDTALTFAILFGLIVVLISAGFAIASLLPRG